MKTLLRFFDRACNTRHGWLMIPITLGTVGALLIGLCELLRAVLNH